MLERIIIRHTVGFKNLNLTPHTPSFNIVDITDNALNCLTNIRRSNFNVSALLKSMTLRPKYIILAF